MRTYHGDIRKLLPHQIYVFGSNTQGRHGKGSALTAKQRFGAIQFKAYGPQGQSYAIVTKDLTKQVHPSISKFVIKMQIQKLYEYAVQNPQLEFFIVYSGIGENLNNYSHVEMAQMFKTSAIPPNIIFRDTFAEIIKTC